MSNVSWKFKFAQWCQENFSIDSPIGKDEVKVELDKVYTDEVRERVRKTLDDWPQTIAARTELIDARDSLDNSIKDERYAEALENFNKNKFLEKVSTAESAKTIYLDLKGKYEKERQDVEKLVPPLKSHAQHAHIQPEIDEIDQHLDDAAEHAKDGRMPEARQSISDADSLCTDAATWADDFGRYVAKRAEAAAVVNSLRGQDNKDLNDALDQLDQALLAADAKAARTQRNYTDAIDDANDILTALRDVLIRDHVTNPQQKLDAVKLAISGRPSETVVAEDVTTAQDGINAISTYLSASQWRKALFQSRSVSGAMTTARKTADRRNAYDDQRKLTTDAFDKIKSESTLKSQCTLLEKLLTKADEAATRQAMRFEDGIGQLKEIELTCTQFLQVVKDRTSYQNERKPVQEGLENLQKHAAAKNIAAPLENVGKLLAQAGTLTGDLAGSDRLDPGNVDYPGARKVIAQAASALAAAVKLADSLADATSAQETAKNATDGPAITRAVEELRRQAETAKSAEHADQAQEEFKNLETALKQAEAAVQKNELDGAPAALATASSLLIQAQTIQMEHARFVAERKPIGDKLAELSAPSAPVAPAKIEAKLKPVRDALADADSQKSAHKWSEAFQALRTATAALDEALLAESLRDQFDTRLDDQKKRAERLPEDTIKNQISQLETAAEDLAGKFEFPKAAKSLDQAEAHLLSSRIGRIAKNNPSDPQFLAAADDILKLNGGDKVLDDLIQSFPNTEKAFNAIVALAEKRFGIKMKSDAQFKPEVAKKFWQMLAKVPSQAKDNPSMKTVERKDPATSGGYYAPSENLVVMNGRPGKSDQGFGANISDELPTDVDDACKPVNDTAVDYFDFATLHEVGHAVDDRLSYMNSKLDQAAFGGWRTHGANVGPIAAEVCKWAAKNVAHKTNAQLVDFTSELILGTAPAEPAAPIGEESDWNEALVAIKKWHKTASANGIWWRQSDVDKITVGDRVYQQAYPNTWVSYLAASRKQAITGYQFRAPGEWFAELYAAYHSGKLKSSHPARKWIANLRL